MQDVFSSTVPLSFFYGHVSPGENPTLFETLVGTLAQCVDQRLASDPEGILSYFPANFKIPPLLPGAASGLVINTCGWVDGVGYTLLCAAARAFRADILLVLGHDRLFADLSRDFASAPAPGVSVVKLERSGGVSAACPCQHRKPGGLSIFSNPLYLYWCGYLLSGGTTG
jgi:polyribonucleotide 5'-hydroxyl-kinase